MSKLSKVNSPYLKASYLVNYQHPEIQKLMESFSQTIASRSPTEQVQYIFRYIRDQVKYKVTHELSTPKFLRASSTLNRGSGHCVSKAILLASLLRGFGIPTRFHFVDLINHRLSEKWKENFGEKLLWHGYVEVLLDGKWIALNAAYDAALCKKHGYFVVEFDGVNNALFQSKDIEGRPFMEYAKDHGVFRKVPYLRMAWTWILYYGPFFWHHRKKNRIKAQSNPTRLETEEIY